MKKIYILFLLICLFTTSAFAQTVEQAKVMIDKGQYNEAKPILKKYVKAQPSNGNYNLWYGICCLKTGAPAEALKYIEIAVKKRIPTGQLYLAETYNDLYQFDDAIKNYEAYIEDLSKKKKSTEEAEKLLEKSRTNLRMLKSVEEVCIIDSFVVDKAVFLDTYKISEEAGKLFTYNNYFKTEGSHLGTVYETELSNKIYYAERDKKGLLNILSKNKMLDEWSNGFELPGSINASGNTNYPYVLADGITIYYASDGEGSIGGYDIFVTRYNTNTDTYLMPENVGMPFNSPFNDYMYVIDEYSNLGWFASDRYQAQNKVCIYVFIPSESKQVYNYESMDPKQIIALAQLHSLKNTWKNPKEVTAARQRLEAAINQKPQEQFVADFEFIIDDNTTYFHLNDFKSPQARESFKKYQQMEKDYYQQDIKLDSQRQWYSRANKAEKAKIAPAILDLEKRVQQMSQELDRQAISVRNTEKQHLK